MDAPERTSGATPGPIRARSALARALFALAGWIFVALAAAGAVLPLLPTTPFLLLAAACWVRSSDRLYQRLVANRWLGPYLRAWREEHRVPRRAKVTAIALVVVTFASSIAFAVDATWVRALLVALGLGLVGFLARLPTGANGPSDGRREDYGSDRGGYGSGSRDRSQAPETEVDA